MVRMLVLFFFMSCFCLIHAQNNGITVIIGQGDNVVGFNDAMIFSLKNALKYEFPIIVSWRIFSGYEIAKTYEDVDFEFATAHPEWFIKHQGDLVLLMPKKYIENGSSKSLEEKTLQEIKVGLKVWHKDKKEKKNFINNFSDLFIQMKDLQDYNIAHETSYEPIQWIFYVTGHGMKENSIVNLSIDEFKKFLNFLNNALSTQFLIYLTCYGGGCNRLIGYDSTIFKFPIVVLGSAETIGHANEIDLNTFFNSNFKKENLYSVLRKSGFFVYEDISSAGKKDLDIYNVPQIRYPGSDKFIILPPDFNEWMVLSDETIQGNDTITIPGITKALLLGEVSKPIELIKKTANIYPFPTILVNSLLQKDYYFNNIESTNTPLKEFLKAFYYKKLKSSYKFFIKKLNVKDREYYDIVITVDPEITHMKASYKKDGIIYGRGYLYKDNTLIDNGDISTDYKNSYKEYFNGPEKDTHKTINALFLNTLNYLRFMYISVKLF